MTKENQHIIAYQQVIKLVQELASVQLMYLTNISKQIASGIEVKTDSLQIHFYDDDDFSNGQAIKRQGALEKLSELFKLTNESGSSLFEVIGKKDDSNTILLGFEIKRGGISFTCAELGEFLSKVVENNKTNVPRKMLYDSHEVKSATLYPEPEGCIWHKN